MIPGTILIEFLTIENTNEGKVMNAEKAKSTGKKH